jgi:hypothetical protein
MNSDRTLTNTKVKQRRLRYEIRTEQGNGKPQKKESNRNPGNKKFL